SSFLFTSRRRHTRSKRDWSSDVCSSDLNAYLATNTSSMSVDGLAEQLKRPQNFCGLHFFNPVPASKLVEVVIGNQTSDELKALTTQWTEGIGKTPVTVNDTPGFASSRLGLALGL